jgi:sensor histidine kinase YesM
MAKNKMISPLLLIPFVENSFKHGTSRMLTHPWVRLRINIERNYLEFCLTNNKPENGIESAGKRGIGLTNVKKRLELIYPEVHMLRIVEGEMSFEVYLKILLHLSENELQEETVNDRKEYYELA